MAAHRSFGTVRKLPSGRFQARYQVPLGHRYRDHAGVERATSQVGRHAAPRTFRTRGEARAFLAAAETALARGEWTPPDMPAPEPVKAWTLAEWAGTVLERRRPLDPERPRKGEWKQKTLEENARLLRRRILPRLGGFELTAITPEAVADWHAALKPDDPSRRKGDRERANAYGLLSRLMREAVDADLIERSPCRVRGGSKPPKPARVPL
ncbi:MAG: hypothetical protein LBD51_03080, partial [Bifidobacteriaceae bacterium]|nr:hypothetical protein [Bifidobacteriaceae bacterium]